MSDLTRTALLALGMTRMVKLEQKEKQKNRARKMKAYLKMCKALKSDLFKLQLGFNSDTLFRFLGFIRPHIEILGVDLEVMSVEERLLMTLEFLATGCAYDELNYSHCPTPELFMSVIPDTCRAIFKCLKTYIKMPKTEKEWEDIALLFENKWNFNHCVGALVAKHIPIEEPSEDSEKFLNHKGFHSIVITGVVNANHEFIFVNIGFEGAYEYVYESTEFFEMLTWDMLGLPKDCPLVGEQTPVPYVFLGETYFLIENIMRPYPLEELTQEKKIFNYRFARAKRVADNAFGILYERFGVLRERSLLIDDEDLNCVVLACCAIHNYMIRHSDVYINEKYLDVEDVSNFKLNPASWRDIKDGMAWIDSHPLVSLYQKTESHSDDKGGQVREQFTKYFCNEGKVPFQDKMVDVV